MKNTKFKFTGKTKIEFGITLNQIEAINAFGSIASGEIGGWIEKESNLSVYDDAWVSDDASVDRKIIICTRSDGYTFLITPDKNKTLVIIASCRYFTIKEAKKHWLNSRKNTQLGYESLLIVDHLEKMAKLIY